MYYSIPWTSDPWYQSSFQMRDVINTANYPYVSYNWQTSYNPYAQSSEPFPRAESGPVTGCISQAEFELNQVFRMLWEQHVAWTRMLIISIAEGLADETAVTERLLQNPSDMADVLARYYGDEVASQFTSLMKDHLVLAAQLVKAAKAGNSQVAAEVEKKWYANADEIAAFLHSFNPYYPEAELRQMLHEHLRMTKDEAVFRLSKQYKSDIEAYDQIEQQALEMADAFATGIVKQFPTIFQ